jgi:hypothetical protein
MTVRDDQIIAIMAAILQQGSNEFYASESVSLALRLKKLVEEKIIETGNR